MSKKYLFLCLIFFFSLVACSSDGNMSNESADSQVEMDTAPQMEKESLHEIGSNEIRNEEMNNTEDTSDQSKVEEQFTERKIIYNANLYVETPKFDQSISLIEEEAVKVGGYIVSSSSYGNTDKENRSGSLVARIPSDHFQAYLTIFEQSSDMKILERTVSGDDVTEQYVDLNARLKSKQVVEERLLAFMKDADKTEDLLKISSDLAKVQEEIEQLTGKINYLENQSDYATVEFSITERKNEIPSVENESKHTWELAKDQFKESVQAIFAFVSSLFVFIIGKSPILVPFLVIAILIWTVMKKKKKRNDTTPS
jgi:hypothetical protein